MSKYSDLVTECVELRKRQVRREAKELTAAGCARQNLASFLGVNERFLTALLGDGT